MRNLEDQNEIKMKAICVAKQNLEETNENINMIDYECIGIKDGIENLDNCNLDNIEEGKNENSLKKSNLNNLVTEIKAQHGGNLGELTEKTDLCFLIVIFIILSINLKYKYLQCLFIALNKIKITIYFKFKEK